MVQLDFIPGNLVFMAYLEQQKFFSMLRGYPRIESFWDLEKLELNVDALENDLSLSSGERAVASFLAAVWLGENKLDFDIAKSVRNMDRNGRELVAAWVKDPFFP